MMMETTTDTGYGMNVQSHDQHSKNLIGPHFGPGIIEDYVNMDRMQSSVINTMYYNFCQTVHPLTRIPRWEAFAYWFMTMSYEESKVLISVVSTEPFATLCILLQQGCKMNANHFVNTVAISPTDANIVRTLKILSQADPLKALGFNNVSILNTKVLCPGLTQEISNMVLQALRLASIAEGYDLFLNEIGKETFASRIINSCKFASHFDDGIYGAPDNLKASFQLLSSVYDTFEKFCQNRRIALFIALILCEHKLPQQFSDEYLNENVVVDLVAPLVGLAPLFTGCLIDDFVEDQGIMANHADPWDEDKPSYKAHAVRMSDHSDEIFAHPEIHQNKVLNDSYMIKVAALDAVAHEDRIVRENTPQWDEVSKHHSRMYDVEPIVAVLNADLSRIGQLRPVIYQIVSDCHVIGNVAKRHNVELLNYGTPVDNANRNQPLSHSAILSLPKIRAVKDPILVIDSLKTEVSTINSSKSWITHKANVEAMISQTIVLTSIFGSSDSTRDDISTYPRLLYWRCVVPYDPRAVVRFDKLIGRLFSYYHVRYIPPRHAHEVQCSLVFIRRNSVNTNKFVGPKGKSKRRASYVIRFLDSKRRFLGVVHRDLVYRHLVSPVFCAMVRDYFCQKLIQNIRADCFKFEQLVLPDLYKYHSASNHREAMETSLKFINANFPRRATGKKKAAKTTAADDFENQMVEIVRILDA